MPAIIATRRYLVRSRYFVFHPPLGMVRFLPELSLRATIVGEGGGVDFENGG